MKKITLFVGSPRKNGNTSILAQALEEKIDKTRFSVEICYLYDYDIKPCVDCRACKKNDLVCILKDQMSQIYTKLEESQIIIIGTPIYWFGPTAQTKLMVDRFRPYFVNKKLSGKRGALILPAGSGEGDCDLTIEMFNRTFEALGIQQLGAVTAKAFDIGDVKNDTTAFEGLQELADQIHLAQ